MSEQNMLIGWLDLSDAEQRRAREYLRQFWTEGTLDELGFGIIRDTLADVFFPATSTIMTHTRYLLFLVASFLRIERERLSGVRAARRLKQLEDDLREVLASKVADEKGVIGASSKEDLKRYPSSIYWNAIKRLGLFLRPDWSQSYYLDHLADFYKVITPVHDDDGLSHLAGAETHNWAPVLEEILSASIGMSGQREFQRQLDFRITRKEARYLKTRFEALEKAEGPSLLAHLLAESFDDAFAYPWEVPCPNILQPLVKHAQAFSMLAKGATLQYYDLLIEERKRKGLPVTVESFTKPFAKWWTLTRKRLAEWNVNDFLDAPAIKCRLRAGDRAFLTGWLQLCRTAIDGTTLLRDARARDLIRQRERTVRPVKRRLGQEKYLRQWTAPESLEGPEFTDPERLLYLLDYRSGIGGTFVREIVAGLKARE